MRGGLVSQRVELYETTPAKAYHDTGFREEPVGVDESRQHEEVDQRRSVAEKSHKGVHEAYSDLYVGSGFVKRGVNHYSKGELEEAEKAFTQALQAQKARLGDSSVYIALSLSNLGAVYLDQGKDEAAQRVLEESLAMKRRLNPRLVLADTLNNLGTCAYRLGQQKKALYYYTSALNDLRSRGGDTKDIANALFNVGRLEIQQREWEKALSNLEVSCALTREVHGTHHQYVAETLDLIGFIHLCTNSLDNAMVSFSGALAIHRRLHGTINTEVANSLLNIGMVREAKGDLPEALEAFETAKDLFSRTRTAASHAGFQATCRSISKIEEVLAKRNQKIAAPKYGRSSNRI